ncbi:src kinase-associated phosphoprotein 2-A-like [Halichondria panicea]|uniref:src kinase-associated phosphoprotein 2-A-like n=1 Tax=Halichondria panicea TaxID=6063 RepID=UPI00312B51AD
MAGITLSGLLDKRGGQDASKGWKKRWCILSDNVIRYYKSETDSTPAGTIFCEDVEDCVEDHAESRKDSKYGFVFKMITRGRDYIFNASSGDIRYEWVRTVKKLLDSHRSENPQIPDVRYATVDVFVNRGIRVNGEIGTVLQSQLTTPTSKAITDDRGWFCDQVPSHTVILNLFTQHGWSLATAFQCNTVPTGGNAITASDTLIFTHPNS